MTGITPKASEISLALCDFGDRWIFTDSDPSGMRVHIPKPVSAEEVRNVIEHALVENAYGIADILAAAIDDTPTPKAVAPTDFGDAHYGVHLFSHEDDWGWTAYGHHEPRRIVAACVSDARADGVLDDLREHTDGKAFFDAIEQKWAVSVESSYYDFEIKFCDQGTPGAIPVTVVTP